MKSLRHRKPQQQSLRLSRSRRWGLYFASFGIWTSGGIWLLLHYFFKVRDEFGPQVNPSEPWLMKLHGAFAFGAIWVFGLMWGEHVTRAWPRGRRRFSGGVLTSAFFVLIVSGYLLYYVGNENARAVVSVLHWGIGLAAPLAFIWHRVRRRKRAKNVVSQEQSTVAPGSHVRIQDASNF